MNDVLYVILNGSLNMSPGKAAAQAVHAVMILENKHRKSFTSNTRRTVIVLEAKDREQLDGIADYLSDACIDYEYYIDEGVNEVQPFSLTALAVEPISSDDEKRELFRSLPLFGSDEENCDDGYCGETEDPNSYVIDRLQADNRELRRLWNENETRAIELSVYLQQPWYKRLFSRFEKKQDGFVS